MLQLRSRLSVDQTRALVDEAEAVSGTVVMAELIVRIHEKEGRVEWPVPDSVRSLR